MNREYNIEDNSNDNEQLRYETEAYYEKWIQEYENIERQKEEMEELCKKKGEECSWRDLYSREFMRRLEREWQERKPKELEKENKEEKVKLGVQYDDDYDNEINQIEFLRILNDLNQHDMSYVFSQLLTWMDNLPSHSHKEIIQRIKLLHGFTLELEQRYFLLMVESI